MAVPAERLNRHQRHRRKVVEILGGACAECGNDDIRVLQIDHIGPKTIDRKMELRRIARGASSEHVQLLCANCHAIKSYYENTGVFD
jgi:5-methylcytosine-specific restriction endonuclease McrA